MKIFVAEIDHENDEGIFSTIEAALQAPWFDLISERVLRGDKFVQIATWSKDSNGEIRRSEV